MGFAEIRTSKSLNENIMIKLLKSILILTVISILSSCNTKEEKVLVFSKTAGYRHGSIETGIEAVKKLGSVNGFKVDATEDASFFTEEILKQYSAIIFLNTTNDVLNEVQQAEMERYIQAGGGFVGIHAATDTEYQWPWYNKLVGAYFKSHPRVQDATLHIIDKKHLSTDFLGDTWVKADEWYNLKSINPDLNILIKIDEKTYEGGENGDDHPISWYHEYDGGRAFYTVMGHTNETFNDSVFQEHLLGGIKYAIGKNNLNYKLAKTERITPESRFTKEVLDFNLKEPMELDELPGKGILFVERQGAIKVYDFKTEKTRTIAELEIFKGNEDGLLGVAVDPDYQNNNWIYLFYSAPGDEPKQHISRFDLIGDKLDLESEKVLIVIPTIRKCCHSGGSLEFGPEGNLFITVGDNTNPFESSGFAPIDEREGRALWDAQKSAANTNDLRGKILRIKPNDDGTYSIPKGNLFPEGTPNTRPEIYIMGCRNPFRHSIDSKTGFVYWGDVGPDAGKGNPERGPHGMGEFDQAKKAGNYGWPYTRGNNQVYNKYDFATETSGTKFDPKNLINSSPNNTGLKNLPPAQESFAWYSYIESEEFPWIGSGGVNPMAGPVFHASNSKGKETFPAYFENKLFLYEWMRDWIYVVSFDENYNMIKADPFMPNTEFSHPMDMIFGSDGNMYILEYGQKWFAQNLDARLSKISYISGNRTPVAKITKDKEVGSQPLNVQFSGSGSFDHDHDDLTYAWSFTSDEIQSTEADPIFTFKEPGTFTVQLTVTDADGKSSKTSTKVLVGNDAPEMTIEIDPKGERYWDNKEINYKITVSDKQDGNTTNGSIDPKDVKVTFTYIPVGQDIVQATVGHQQNNIPEGRTLIEGSDCKACHDINIKVNGPSYTDISLKYGEKDKDYLVSKVIKGGSGVWGETMMLAHPQLKVEEVDKIVNYILSLNPDRNPTVKSLALVGKLKFNEHVGSDDIGIYVLMASYLDKGNAGQENSALAVRKKIIFESYKIEAEDANGKSKGGIRAMGSNSYMGMITHNSYLRFDNIELDNLKSITFAAMYNENYQYNGLIEIREDSATGKIIGQANLGYFDKSKKGKKYYSIPIEPTKEKSSLYLVFKNPEDEKQLIAKANWILLNYAH